MDTQTVKEIIKTELPVLIKTDLEIRKFILDITRNIIVTKADRDETENRFDKILDEMKKDRKEQAKKWTEQDKKWWEQNKLLKEMSAKQTKKWAEQDKKWADQDKKWAEQDKKWWEQIKLLKEKWAEQDKKLAQQDKKWKDKWEVLRNSDEDLRQYIKISIGALGARWGRDSEASFRNALKGILEKHFDIKVINVIEYDNEGEVFGHPDQIELDIIIKNSLLIICELKSSMSNSDMYAFYKKIKFYEKRHNKKADSLIAISPMIDDKAKKVASKLGIQIYSSAYDFKPL